MEKHKSEKLPSLAKYLPAIFQKQATEECDPLRAILKICEANFSGIEQTINHVERFFDPETAPGKRTDHSDEFLSLLASWVALRLDEGWFAADGDEPERGHGGEQKARYLIKNAAVLYRSRGTVSGLKRLLKAFYDIETLIVEWAWPQGMVIGVSSSIEEQTFIIDPPDFTRSFIIIIKLSAEERSAIESSGNWIDVPYAVDDVVQKGRLQACAGSKTGPAKDIPLLEKLRKIKQLVDLEKPIHTQCFIAFQSWMPHVEEAPMRPYLVVGVESIIEYFIIDGE